MGRGQIREKEKVEANLAAQISQLQDDFKVGPWIAETMIELFGAVTGEVDSQLGRQTDALLAMRSIIFHYWILEMLSLHSTTQQRLHSRLDVRSTLLQTFTSFSWRSQAFCSQALTPCQRLYRVTCLCVSEFYTGIGCGDGGEAQSVTQSACWSTYTQDPGLLSSIVISSQHVSS